MSYKFQIIHIVKVTKLILNKKSQILVTNLNEQKVANFK